MALYEFHCENCGPFEVRRSPYSSGELACGGCGGPTRRIFHSPLLRTLDAPLRAARDREARSAHEPEVVRRRAGG